MDYVVRVAGTVDRALSLAAFAAALEGYIADTGSREAQVRTAVMSVFDANPGKALAAPLVVSAAMAFIPYTTETFMAESKRVAQFVKDNSHEDFRTGALFVSKKGPGGGVRRWSDSKDPGYLGWAAEQHASLAASEDEELDSSLAAELH